MFKAHFLDSPCVHILRHVPQVPPTEELRLCPYLLVLDSAIQLLWPKECQQVQHDERIKQHLCGWLDCLVSVVLP